MHRAPATSWIIVFFLVHVTVWTLYGVLSNPGALHPDMLEAYLWGHEFQLGYYKHPPLWAWLAGAWFEIFPRSNWAYFILAAINSSLALLGIWRLYGLYAGGRAKWTAFLLLFATPFYTFMALRLNANTILLSLWPWAAYFFAKSIERLSLSSAGMFGVLAAAALLSKYYSAILLAACVAASFLHPNARKYYRSAAPYLSVGVCCLLLIPHLLWVLGHQFQTLKYAESKASFSDAKVYASIVAFFFGCIALNSVAIVLGLVSKPAFTKIEDAGYHDRSRFLAVLALAPFALTILVGLLLHLRLSTNFAIPIFFLFPLVLIRLLKPNIARLEKLASSFAAAVYLAALPIGFTGSIIMFNQNKTLSVMPSLEIAQEAERLWAKATRAPVRTVAGSYPYAMVAAFYGDGEVKEFTRFDPSLAPWISPERLARTGLLAICVEGDLLCIERATGYMSPAASRHTVIAAHHFRGVAAQPRSFEVFVIPPK
ncbi:MAG: glycosyltransferase family 39 protein [Rhodomicrobium sp.]